MKIIFILKDFLSIFARNILKSTCEELKKSWTERIKVSSNDFELKVQKQVQIFNVEIKPDLSKKYLKKFVSCSLIDNHINLKDDLKIINKNQSVVLMCQNVVVGAVIRDAAPKNISKHFGIKIKLTTDVHYKMKRGDSHASFGKMVGHGSRKDPIGSFYGDYAYEDKSLNPEAQKIYEKDGNSIAKWLYENSRQYLPWSVLSYDEFKLKADLSDDEVIGALFCTKNYEATGHRDNDRTDYAIGYVYEEGTVEDGYFFYPEYGVAIEMTSNSMWCWLTKAVHGTAKLKLSNDGNRYTAVVSLSETTAKAIERKKGLRE